MMAGSPPAAARPARTPRSVDYVCNVCGGNTVTRDAWAEWDSEVQEWTLGAAYDYAYCHDCQEETNLVAVDRETREPTGG